MWGGARYEKVSETPQQMKPPGKGDVWDLGGIKDAAAGLATNMSGMFQNGQAKGKSPPKAQLPAHLRPPDPNWDGTRGAPAGNAFTSNYSQGGFPGPQQGQRPPGPPGPPGPRSRDPYDTDQPPDGKAAMNLGNKYAKSYSSANPPPRPGDNADGNKGGETVAAKQPSFMDELGMDKEPTRKERKKKQQRVAEQKGLLVTAAQQGDLAEVKELLELGVDVDEVKADDDSAEDGSVTALLCAAAKGHADVVKCLIKAGATLDAMDSDGNTSLHLAAQKGHGQVIHRLCKAGANKDLPGASGATPLHLAARKGRDEAVEVLVEAGADIGSRDGKGATPLHAAATGGHEDIVDYLLEKGADPAAEDKNGKTAKNHASKKGHDDIAKTIKRAIKEAANKEDEDED